MFLQAQPRTAQLTLAARLPFLLPVPHSSTESRHGCHLCQDRPVTAFQTILICFKKPLDGWMQPPGVAFRLVLLGDRQIWEVWCEGGKGVPLVLKTKWLTLGGLASQSAQT